ncbi:hypothetical protein DNTS_002557, partial [Danionella cerebrum]
IHPPTHPSILLFICETINPPINPFNQTIHPTIHPPIHTPIHPAIHLLIRPFIYLSNHPSIKQFIHPPTHPCFNSSVKLLTHPPIKPFNHPSTELSNHPSIDPPSHPSAHPDRARYILKVNDVWRPHKHTLVTGAVNTKLLSRGQQGHWPHHQAMDDEKSSDESSRIKGSAHLGGDALAGSVFQEESDHVHVVLLGSHDLSGFTFVEASTVAPTNHSWALSPYPCLEVYSSTTVQQQRCYVHITIMSRDVKGREATLEKQREIEHERTTGKNLEAMRTVKKRREEKRREEKRREEKRREEKRREEKRREEKRREEKRREEKRREEKRREEKRREKRRKEYKREYKKEEEKRDKKRRD